MKRKIESGKQIILTEYERDLLRMAKDGLMEVDLIQKLNAVLNGTAPNPAVEFLNHPHSFLCIFPGQKLDNFKPDPRDHAIIMRAFLGEKIRKPFAAIYSSYLSAYKVFPYQKADKMIDKLKKSLWKHIEFGDI